MAALSNFSPPCNFESSPCLRAPNDIHLYVLSLLQLSISRVDETGFTFLFMSIILYSFGRLHSTAETVMDSIHAHESLDGEQIHSKYGKIDDKLRHCVRSSAEY